MHLHDIFRYPLPPICGFPALQHFNATYELHFQHFYPQKNKKPSLSFYITSYFFLNEARMLSYPRYKDTIPRLQPQFSNFSQVLHACIEIEVLLFAPREFGFLVERILVKLRGFFARSLQTKAGRKIIMGQLKDLSFYPRVTNL